MGKSLQNPSNEGTFKRSLIIYADHLTYKDGIYTWIRNFCNMLNTVYNITILSKIFRNDMNNELSILAQTEIWKADKEYESDILLYMVDFVEFPLNINAKKEYKIVHCDYSDIKRDLPDITGHFIAVSETAARGFIRRFNRSCSYIESVVTDEKKRSKVLHLISCSRIYKNKGLDRMYQLADTLNKAGIRYIWHNFTEIDKNGLALLKTKSQNDIIHLPAIDHNKLLDYIADSDYLVQLSDAEGYCYAVHEALVVGTPVIVTDIPTFRQEIQNGVNGYKVPLNMSYIDIDNIVNNIPRTHYGYYNLIVDECKKKWTEYLGI